MGKKVKSGKQRIDRFYKLAKESGYRSRAAFKLLQLNRKFEFLQNSRVCIDLCAAPGGWMQVAVKNMPVSSVIIGVDLNPIQSIPGCISLKEDITTNKCKVSLTKALQNWKADLVLNDGSPNLGKSWVHDAFQQATLTLSALKLACEFLKPGGWFITKLFRSKDYNALLWVFKQLFRKVHSTKPLASRKESAEIFIVCQYFKAPDKLDKKFFDPKYVFEELELESQNKLRVYHPEKQKKAKAEGYAENDYTLHHKLSVLEFIKLESPEEGLQGTSEIVIDDDEILNHALTTKEIKECCKDLKVLGRKDLRNIMTWWKHMKKLKEPEEDNKNEEENKQLMEIEEQKDEDEEELEQFSKKIEELDEEERKEMKRKIRKTKKEKKKLQDRLDLRMVIKGDAGPKLECEDMFDLKKIRTKQDLKIITDQKPEYLAESDVSEDDTPKPKITKYERFGGDQLHSSGTHYIGSDSEDEANDTSEDDNSENEEAMEELEFSETELSENNEKSVIENEKEIEQHPLISDLDPSTKKQKKINKAQLWFEKDIFKNVEDEKMEDLELDTMIDSYKNKGAVILGQEGSKKTEKITKNNKKIIPKHDSSDDDSDTEEESDSESDYDIEKDSKLNMKSKKSNQGFEIAPKEENVNTQLRKRKLNVEGMALATMMISSKKIKRDMLDDGWNRYAFNDDKLPDWFTKDEEKHMQKPVPVSKELMDEYKQRLREINVRPIKKVIEAKARKKQRTLKRFEKAKKKVENIMENADISSKDKSDQIRKLYKKAEGNKKREVKYVVAKKALASKKGGRPAGYKGPYKVVDPRMKKDTRRLRNETKKAKGKGKGRGKGKGNNRGKKPAPQRHTKKSKAK